MALCRLCLADCVRSEMVRLAKVQIKFPIALLHFRLAVCLLCRQLGRTINSFSFILKSLAIFALLFTIDTLIKRLRCSAPARSPSPMPQFPLNAHRVEVATEWRKFWLRPKISSLWATTTSTCAFRADLYRG